MGAGNHAAFVRYTLTQFVVCASGLHYALSACGRPGWSATLTCLAPFPFGVLTLVVLALAVTHGGMVLVGINTRCACGCQRQACGHSCGSEHRMAGNLRHIAAQPASWPSDAC